MSFFTLYEDLDKDYLELLDEETDEQKEQEILMQLQEDVSTKIEKLALVKKSIDAQAKMLKEEEAKLKERRQATENKADRIKDQMEYLMRLAKLDKVKGARATVWIQNNPPSVEILDEASIPKEYWIPQPDSLDKKGIIEKLKTLTQDEIIELGYAKLVQGQSIRIK